jgi:serine/threonine protein kinase
MLQAALGQCVGPSATSIGGVSIPTEKWKLGRAGRLCESDPYFQHVEFWKNFYRGTATPESFTNLDRLRNPHSQQPLLKQLSHAGFEIAVSPSADSSGNGYAIFFGQNDMHALHPDCQHWAVYERLGAVVEEGGSEYVVQLLNKKAFKHKEHDEKYVEYQQFSLKFVCLYLPTFIPRLGQRDICAHLKFIAHGCFGGAFRLSYPIDHGRTRKSCIIKRNDTDFASFKFVMREKLFLTFIDHPNIVKLHYQYVSPNYDASSKDSQNTVFFIEEDGGRTVLGYIREIFFNVNDRFPPVPVQMIYRICSDILNALIYLESRGILHRDIKGDSNALPFSPRSSFCNLIAPPSPHARCSHLFLPRLRHIVPPGPLCS